MIDEFIANLWDTIAEGLGLNLLWRFDYTFFCRLELYKTVFNHAWMNRWSLRLTDLRFFIANWTYLIVVRVRSNHWVELATFFGNITFVLGDAFIWIILLKRFISLTVRNGNFFVAITCFLSIMLERKLETTATNTLPTK